MDLSNSIPVYRVLRNIELEGESNSIQLELKHGLDDEESEQIILEASEKGFLRLVEGSNPKRYEVNFERLTDEWFQLWEGITGSRPVAPKNFEKYIEQYTRSYMEDEKNSTIRDMLVEDFYIAIHNFSGHSKLPKDFRELKNELNSQFEGKKSPAEHFKYALQHPK